MNDLTTVGYIFQELATQLPYMLVCLCGILVGVALWQRAPRSSLWVIIACALTLLFLILHPIAWQVAMRTFSGTEAVVRRRINVAFALFWSVERALFAGMLLFAVYAGRSKQ